MEIDTEAGAATRRGAGAEATGAEPELAGGGIVFRTDGLRLDDHHLVTDGLLIVVCRNTVVA